MKEIFTKKYMIWWFILCLIIGLKVKVIGLKPGGLSAMEGYENHGVIFWIIGTLLTGFIFSLPLYLIYRLIKKKSNNDVLMILISIMSGILLLSSI